MSLDNESRNQLRELIFGSDAGLSDRLLEDPAAWRELIVRAKEADNETTDILMEAVLAARAADVSWESIGSALQISRQAAQQRFGKARSEDNAGPDQRRFFGLTAFNEIGELNRVGRYGWHSVGNGPLYHAVERDELQWEHHRTTFPTDPARMERDGWQRAGSGWFPWVYWKRRLDVPALEGDAGIAQ